MSSFCALYSGSSGNSMVVSSGGASLLVDAGVSCKAILEALQQRDVNTSALQGILVTHEHIDHVRGLKVLLKKLPLPVYASAGTLDNLVRHEMVPAGADLREISGTAEIGGMEINPFATPHDAAGPLGFAITTTEGEQIGIATDLGHITDEVDAALCGCATVVVEANYDEHSLRTGHYPYYLKERIASPFGHLSNAESAALCLRLVEKGARQIVLCHLSRENNTPGMAAEAITGHLQQFGCCAGSDYRLQVARRSQPSDIIRF